MCMCACVKCIKERDRGTMSGESDLLKELALIQSGEINLKFTSRLEFQARSGIAILKDLSSSLGNAMFAPNVFN